MQSPAVRALPQQVSVLLSAEPTPDPLSDTRQTAGQPPVVCEAPTLLQPSLLPAQQAQGVPGAPTQISLPFAEIQRSSSATPPGVQMKKLAQHGY